MIRHIDTEGSNRVVDPETAKRYRAEGWWGDDTLSDVVSSNAAHNPSGDAFISEGSRLTWADYRDLSDGLAGILMAADLDPGERIAVCMPDGAALHVCYLAAEKAGLTTVGIGIRAGLREMHYLLERTNASTLITAQEHNGQPAHELIESLRSTGLSLPHHMVVPNRMAVEGLGSITFDGTRMQSWHGLELVERIAARRLGPDDLFIINSTSGTTGMPKCVLHTQNRHVYINQMAKLLGALSSDDIFLSALPAPFGFGLWTAHFTPAMVGAPTVLMERFSASETVRLIASERVTVLCCVSTQFVMMLNCPEMEMFDLSSLRVMFTGGEPVPYERARNFEERTGAVILQFYGSNESGVATGTRLTDSVERRLRTAGGTLPGTELRLFRDGQDVTQQGRGQPGSRGPAICLGYLDDPEANAQLFTADGFVLHADVCTIDDEGSLRVEGRTSDLIIRGGKNISAALVEVAVLEHPAVALAAAVAVPDDIFGEKVGVFVELKDGGNLTIDGLASFLLEQGLSKETLPEHLFVRDSLPRSSGEKVAKGELRREAARMAGLPRGPIRP